MNEHSMAVPVDNLAKATRERRWDRGRRIRRERGNCRFPIADFRFSAPPNGQLAIGNWKCEEECRSIRISFPFSRPVIWSKLPTKHSHSLQSLIKQKLIFSVERWLALP